MDSIKSYFSQLTVQQKVLTAFLVLTFCVAMNYVSRNMGGGGIQLPYNNFTWVFASTFILISFIFAAFNRVINYSVGFLSYLGIVLLLLLPLLYTNRLFLDVEVLRFAGLGAGILFFLSLYQNKGNSLSHILLKILFVSTLIQSAWGILQFYFILESNVLFYRADLGRPYGVFQQVNDFTSFLAVGSMLAIYYAFSSKEKLSNKKLVSLALIVFANFHLGVLADADAALAVAVVSVVLYLVYFIVSTKQFKLSLTFLAVMLIGILIPRDWVDFRNSSTSDEVTIDAQKGMIDGQTLSNSTSIDSQSKNIPTSAEPIERKAGALGTRATIYPVVFGMIQQNPWLGYGVGSFTKQYLLAQGAFLLENPNAPAEFNLNHPHNEVLYWVVELGAFVMIPFVLLLFVWFYGVRKGVIEAKVLLLALPLVLHSMVELPFYHTAVHFLAFLLILFCADRSKVRSFQLPKFNWLVVAPGLLFAFIQIQIFLLSTMHALQMFLAFNQTERQEIKLLTGVNNPAAFKHRFEFELFQWQLQKGLREGRIAKQELLNYIYWAFSVTQYAPLQSTYENFVDALAIYGNKDAALKYAKEGWLMYPNSDKLRRRVEGLKNGK